MEEDDEEQKEDLKDSLLRSPTVVIMSKGKVVFEEPEPGVFYGQADKFVCLYRVSTQRQANQTKNKVKWSSLKIQRDECRTFVAKKAGLILHEHYEVASGARESQLRSEFQAAVELCKKHGATLLTHKIDRLTRSIKTVSWLKEQQIPLVFVAQPGISILVLDILTAIAEDERRSIVERTRLAKQARRNLLIEAGNAPVKAARKRPAKGGTLPGNRKPPSMAKRKVGGLKTRLNRLEKRQEQWWQIHLHRRQGMTEREIATKLGVSPSVVHYYAVKDYLELQVARDNLNAARKTAAEQDMPKKNVLN